jgi:hypothetical protein
VISFRSEEGEVDICAGVPGQTDMTQCRCTESANVLRLVCCDNKLVRRMILNHEVLRPNIVWKLIVVLMSRQVSLFKLAIIAAGDPSGCLADSKMLF